MSFLILIVSKAFEYLFAGVPSGPIRNFSKFQATSERLTGAQTM